MTDEDRIIESLKYRRVVNNDGSVTYFDENNKLHREGGPAAITSDGEFWYTHGEMHREDGPAAIIKVGSLNIEYWYKHGIRIKN